MALARVVSNDGERGALPKILLKKAIFVPFLTMGWSASRGGIRPAGAHDTTGGGSVLRTIQQLAASHLGCRRR
jgi:hypothetical protein